MGKSERLWGARRRLGGQMRAEMWSDGHSHPLHRCDDAPHVLAGHCCHMVPKVVLEAELECDRQDGPVRTSLAARARWGGRADFQS